MVNFFKKRFHLQVEAVSVVGESGPIWEVISRCLDTNKETKATLLLPFSNFCCHDVEIHFHVLEKEQKHCSFPFLTLLP
jgi:hypothetical protein